MCLGASERRPTSHKGNLGRMYTRLHLSSAKAYTFTPPRVRIEIRISKKSDCNDYDMSNTYRRVTNQSKPIQVTDDLLNRFRKYCLACASDGRSNGHCPDLGRSCVCDTSLAVRTGYGRTGGERAPRTAVSEGHRNVWGLITEL